MNSGILSQIQGFNKQGLTPTTTTVRYATAILGEVSEQKLGFEDEELIEDRDSDEVLKEKVHQLAEMIKNSNYVVVYTGAGASTSANLTDYRGSNGIWTLQDRGLTSLIEVDLAAKHPTYTHYSILDLVNKGVIKHVVSTNTDGFHLKSGLPEEHLSELHGNCFHEVCDKCHKRYKRNFVVSRYRGDHLTGRNCEEEGCDGQLRDTVVGFGEYLPKDAFAAAYDHSSKADLALVLGTSMRVPPSCKLPKISFKKNGGHMVIVNLQHTPSDEQASLRIGAECDAFMKLLMDELSS